MAHATVIKFPRPHAADHRTWTQAEMQDLLALFAVHARNGAATAWEVGATESGDPQFYLTSARSDAESVCVSRIGTRYVALDECGVRLAEENSLKTLVASLARGIAHTRGGSVLVRCFLALATVRIMIEQKLEPILVESAEHLDGFAPGLMALI